MVLCPPRSALIIGSLMATLIGTWSLACRAEDAGGKNKSEEITISPRWKAGDRVRYERVKSRRKLKGGVVTSQGSGNCGIDLSIVEAGPRGYLVRWRIGETAHPDPRAGADPTVRAVTRLIEGLDIDIELDDEATILGLRNWAKLKDSGLKMLDAMMRDNSTASLDAKTKTALRSTLEAMFATKEQTEMMFTKEPQMYFLPIGRTYPGVGQPIEYDDKLPNPFGGDPFPCKGRIILQSYDSVGGRAVVTWTQSPDPKETARILGETLNKFDQRLGRTKSDAQGIKNFMVEDRAEFVVDTKTGWIEQFTYTRTGSANGDKQEDTLSMRRQARTPRGEPTPE